MDTAVSLVQTYLRVNGYFTVAEYPILEVASARHIQTVTDIDIMGFRFPGAGAAVAGEVSQSRRTFNVDPMLRSPTDMPDMILGEVKEGRAEFNSAMRNPEVLAVALARFGCCPLTHSKSTAIELLKHGQTKVHNGHLVRLVAFGSTHDSHGPRSLVIPLGHIFSFLKEFLQAHWETIRHSQIKDPTLSLLALMEKAKMQ